MCDPFNQNQSHVGKHKREEITACEKLKISQFLYMQVALEGVLTWASIANFILNYNLLAAIIKCNSQFLFFIKSLLFGRVSVNF